MQKWSRFLRRGRSQPARRPRISYHLLGKARHRSERALSVRTKRGIRNPRRRRAQWPGVKCGKPLRSCTPEILQSLIGTRPPAILKVDCPEGAGGGLGHWFLSHRWERNSPPSGGETLRSLIEKSEKAHLCRIKKIYLKLRKKLTRMWEKSLTIGRESGIVDLTNKNNSC